MATVTTSVQGGNESGTTHTVSGLSYEPGDMLVALSITKPTASITVTDSGSYAWTRTETTAALGIGGRIYTRVATNSATNTTLSYTLETGGALSFISFRVRPDAGKAIRVNATGKAVGLGSTISLAMPGTITTSSILIGAHMVDDDVYFTDSDTTNGSWSAVNVRTSSGADRAVASQWKIPTAAGAQTYNGSLSSSEYWIVMALNLLEIDLGYWGVKA